MSFQFCWEYNTCSNTCPVRDLKLLFCWTFFMDESRAGLKNCPQCDFQQAWRDSGKSAPRSNKTGRKTILVIDDEPNILYALEELVRINGYECVSALNGEEGLVIARGMKPDLVISDIIMPGINGYQLCHSLKTDSETSKIPIILVTVRTAEKDHLDGHLAGADAYIHKPFSASMLKKNIESLIE